MLRSCRATNLDSTIPLSDRQACPAQVYLCLGPGFSVLVGRAPAAHQSVLVAAQLRPTVLPAPVVRLERVRLEVAVTVLLQRRAQALSADVVRVQAGQHSPVTVQHD